MRIYLASDHAGFEMKNYLVLRLGQQGFEARDLGPAAYEPDDSYPPYCIETGVRVAADEGSLGVVIGGSGNGEQIAANKVPGVRAALAWSTETAALAREHNDAQVVALGARMHTLEEAEAIVSQFVNTPFSGEPRHRDRIAMVLRYENTGQPPPLPSH